MEKCRRKDDIADVAQRTWKSEQRLRREDDGSGHDNQSHPFRENAYPSGYGAVSLTRFHGVFVMNSSLSKGPLLAVSEPCRICQPKTRRSPLSERAPIRALAQSLSKANPRIALRKIVEASELTVAKLTVKALGLPALRPQPEALQTL